MGIHAGTTPILTFHKIEPRFEWGVTRIPPARFRWVLEILKRYGYSSVSIGDLVENVDPLPPSPIVFTFDDSYESVYTHGFPLMKDFGFRATVFVIAGYVGRSNAWDVNLGGLRFVHLSWDQIRELVQAGFEIASHTFTHPDLTRVDEKRLVDELERSKKMLEDRFGISVPFIAFPFGKANATVLRACRRAGYTHGIGCHVSSGVKKSKEMVVFGRKAFYLFDTKWNLDAKLGRNAWTAVEDARLRIINACSMGSSWVKPPRPMPDETER